MKHLAVIFGIVIISWFSVNDSGIKEDIIRLDEIELNLTNFDYNEELESVNSVIFLEEIELNLTNTDYEEELETATFTEKIIENKKFELEEIDLNIVNYEYIEELDSVDNVIYKHIRLE